MKRGKKQREVMPTDPVELGRLVVRRCLEAGFSLAGVCQARPTDFRTELNAWLSAGKHGEMSWMAEQADLRADPLSLMPEAKSVIVVADQYAARGESDSPTADDRGPAGMIARYARGRDYHLVMKQRLHAMADRLREEIPHASFRTTVDSAPIMEREHAARAGIGWVGKHTLVIHPRAGSWVLLGCVLTTLDLRPEPDFAPTPDHCGSCTRCIDACPTGAITPHEVDARRCVSYLTIEHRSVIDESLHAGIGTRLFGCDTCQEVCPHNAPVEAPGAEPRVNPRYRSARASMPLLEVLSWQAEDRQFGLGVSAMKRATLEMFKRNALIAATNAVLSGACEPRHEQAVIQRIKCIAADEAEDAVVRSTAEQSLARISGRSDAERGRIVGT